MIGQIKDKSNGKIIDSVKDSFGRTIYEAWKKLLASGIFPLTLNKCKGVDLVNYNIEGNSKQSLLPEEYQQLDYIENHGKQCIDTGLIPTNNTSVELTYQALDTAGSQYILGSRQFDTYGTIDYAINGSSARTDWDVRFNGKAVFSNVARTTDRYNSTISLTEGNGTWTLTNLDTAEVNTFDIANANINATKNLYIFGYNTALLHSNLRVYECKIYEGSELIRHFIPCYRKSDNVIGMYDLVNDIFYINATTSADVFSKGVDLPSQNTPIEIESVGERTKNFIYIPDIDGSTASTVINCNITESFTVSCQEYPSSIANNDGVETSIWRFQIKYLDGKLAYIVDNVLKGVTSYGSTITATKENPVVEITYRGIYIREGAYRKFLVEYGDTITNYEPYGYKIPVKANDELGNEITTNIYLNEPLRKVGDYADYIDFETKQVVRKVGVKTFDGTEEWILHTTTKEGGYGVFRNENLLTPLIGAPIAATFMSHFILTDVGSTASWGLGLYRFTYSDNSLIASSRVYISATQTTVEEFTTWLANNKPSIVYPLAEEDPQQIELPNIPTFKGTTILSVDTTLQPSNASVAYMGKK